MSEPEVLRFHEKDQHKLGYSESDSKLKRIKDYVDPNLKNQLYMAKLVKWRFFMYADKLIDFDKSIIEDVLGKITYEEDRKIGLAQGIPDPDQKKSD